MPNALQIDFIAAGLIDAVSGKPLAGGKINTFDSGTNDPQTTWKDANKDVEHANPVELDEVGQALIFADGSLKIIVDDVDDVEQYTLDGLTYDPNVSANRTITPVSASYTVTTSDNFVNVDATGGVRTMSIYTAVGNAGKELTFKKNDSSVNAVLLDPSGNETIDEFTIFPLTEQNQTLQIRSDGSNWVRVDKSLPNLVNFIGGLNTVNGTDADHDIDIGSGVAMDDGQVFMMRLDNGITKQLDLNWTLGNDGGGLDTGPIAADTDYYLWLIQRSDTGVVDGLFSLSDTAPTMPSSYDRKRLIWMVHTNSSANIVAYDQQGDYCRYTGDVIQDINDATITDSTFELASLSVPANGLAHIYVHVSNTTSTDPAMNVTVRPNGSNDTVDIEEAFMQVGFGGTTFDTMNTQGFVGVDGNSDIQYAASEASGITTIQIRTMGFHMLTRRSP